MIETNFYRKLKQGAKNKEESKNVPITTGNIDFLKSNMMKSNPDSFSIQLPAGAKIVAIAGTADEYLRCVFAYYKI